MRNFGIDRLMLIALLIKYVLISCALKHYTPMDLYCYFNNTKDLAGDSFSVGDIFMQL